VCLSAYVRPHYCTDPDVTWRHGRGCPVVVHYWADLQSGHGLRFCGNITRTLLLQAFFHPTTWCKRPAGRGLRALLAADWRGDRGRSQNYAPYMGSGVAGSPVIGRRWGALSTLLRRPGLRASSDGVLATRSERKMFAITCLYSLYAWYFN